MYVNFVPRPTSGVERLICDAEIVFDEAGPLSRLKLVGFSLWYGQDGDIYVTVPARSYGSGPERRFYDYLRSAGGDPSDMKNLKSWIIAEYRRTGGPQPPAAPAMARIFDQEGLA